MIIRHWLPGDAEHEQRIFNIAAARLPGFAPIRADDARRNAVPKFDPATRFYAEEDGEVVAFAAFEPAGQVALPWCLPGHEKMMHPLLAAVMRAMAERKSSRAYATCRSDWPEQIEFFEDHGFDRVRDMVNFTQSIADLPTMFQRPGLDVEILRASEIDAVDALAPRLLRLHGPALVDYFFHNRGFPVDATYVLRKDGVVRGVGMLIDDAAFAKVDTLDAHAADIPVRRLCDRRAARQTRQWAVQFRCGTGKGALLIGQDLLWYGTSRLETNTFDMLAAQAPAMRRTCSVFMNGISGNRGAFRCLKRAVGTGSRF